MKSGLRRSEYSREYHRRMVQAADAAGGMLLEIESNEGAVLREAQADGLDAIGIDIDADVLAPASSGLRQAVGDAKHLPWRDGSFSWRCSRSWST